MNKNPNTLRLGRHELYKLLEEIDMGQTEVPHPDREFVRWPYRLISMEMTVEHTSGLRTSMFVATRNISRGGICVLHSAYIHPGVRCEVVLQLDKGKSQTISGRVVRCSHAGGRVHEVGVEFDEQISTKNLLGLDPLNEAYSLERVEPTRLQGVVITVTKSDIERDILIKSLEDTKLVMKTANDIEMAQEQASKGCDLLIIDYQVGEEKGTDFVRQLRDDGLDVPVIVMTSDTSEERLDEIRSSQASGILTKPITQDRLYQAIAEFLHADGDGGPLYTTLVEQDSMFPLLEKFYAAIKEMAHAIETAARSDQKEACAEICQTLSGIALPLGFGVISELSIIAERRLSESENVRGAIPELRTLISACRRVKVDDATLKVRRDEAKKAAQASV